MQYEIILSHHVAWIFFQSEQERWDIYMFPTYAVFHECINHVPVPSHHIERDPPFHILKKQLTSEQRLPQIDPPRPGYRASQHQPSVVATGAIYKSQPLVFLDHVEKVAEMIRCISIVIRKERYVLTPHELQSDRCRGNPPVVKPLLQVYVHDFPIIFLLDDLLDLSNYV